MAGLKQRLPSVETGHWSDDGCDFHPACLTCPFSVCRYDAGPGVIRVERDSLQVVALREDGASIATIMEALAVSRRTVYRLLKRSDHAAA